MELFGYLDAGTGSLLVQAAIGAAVAIGVVVKAYWHKIRKLFGKRSPQQAEADLREE